MHSQPDLNGLSTRDREALERAACIFNTPLSDLVQHNWHRTGSTIGRPEDHFSTQELQHHDPANFPFQGPSRRSESAVTDPLRPYSNAHPEALPFFDPRPGIFGGDIHGDLAFYQDSHVDAPESFNQNRSANWADLSDLSILSQLHRSEGILGSASHNETRHTWAEAPRSTADRRNARVAEQTRSQDITARPVPQQIDLSENLNSIMLPGQVLSSVSDRSAESGDDGSPVGEEEPFGASVTSQASNSMSLLGSSLSSTASEWSMLDFIQNEDLLGEEAPADASGQDAFQWISCDPRQSLSVHQRQRRGPFQSQQLREETGNTRKLKACVRCRMQKIRCQINDNDPSGVCRTCQAVSKQKIYTLPCVRYKITECTLYRIGKAPGLEFTFRWPVMKLKDISKWASTEVRSIQVKSDVCSTPLHLSVRKFAPILQDSLHRSWMDGRVKKFKETTPYAIVNMGAAAEDMGQYITTHVFESMSFFLEGRDELIVQTYKFARKHMLRTPFEDERILMSNFFRLWFAIRRTATTEHIVGDDTLDMVPETVDRSYPLFGKVPLPPVLIQQLDMILTLRILTPLRKKVLEEFQRLVLANKPRSWLTMYLITFMFLHSCAALSAENYRNARKQGLKRRYAIPTFISELHHGANVFLSHYHYGTKPCNPFNLNWKRRQITPFAELTPEEIHFLVQTSKMVKERAERIQVANEIALYEDDLYFVAQMFEEDWTPRNTVIDFDDGTVGDVPLRKFYSDQVNKDEK